MKKINLEKIAKAWIEYKRALGRRDFAAKPEDAEKAKQAVEDAKAAFGEAAAGLKAAIEEAEGRSRERRITPRDVVQWVETIDCELDISKASMKGVTARVVDGAQHFPSAYKYTPEATAFWMEHNGRSWSVTRIERVPCNFQHKVELSLTDAAKAAVISRVSQF